MTLPGNKFKRPDSLFLRGLRASDAESKEILRRLASQLREGTALTESMQNKHIGLVYFEQTTGDTAAHGEQSDNFDLPAEVRELSTGAVSLFEQDNELFLIDSAARLEMGFYPFDEKLKHVAKGVALTVHMRS
jgi:hypothetical protein